MPRARRPDVQVEAVRALTRLARLVERSTGELSLAHYRILAAVAAGDERASRMATRLALGKPTISAAVDALCQRGLMTRRSVEGDQRATALSVTADGTAALRAVEDSIIARIGPVLERTPNPTQILESLNQLGSALDELGEELLAAGGVPRR